MTTMFWLPANHWSHAFLVAVFVLSTPPLLAHWGVISHYYQWWYLYPLLWAIPSAWRLVRANESWSHGWLPYMVSCALLGAAIVLWAVTVGDGFQGRVTAVVLFMALVLSVLQEILFRTYLVGRMKQLGHDMHFIAFTSGVTFSLIHLFFPGEHVNWLLLGTFVMGYILAYLYYQQPNLLASSVTHFGLNVLCVAVGTIFT